MSYRRILIITAIVLMGGILALLGIALARQQSLTETNGTSLVNRPAPDFTLPLFSSGEVILSGLRGKPIVIIFWASWCPPCREEAPTLEKVWRAYKDKGIIFVGVDVQDKEADARTYMKEFDITYPNGPDIGGEIAAKYGIFSFPTTFFVNGEGLIVSRWIGALDEGRLVTGIKEILR